MASYHRPLSYTDDVETIPADEADDIGRVGFALEMLLNRTRAKSGPMRADVHRKTHGYAHGELRVLPNLPDELAQGLFEHENIFPTVVRFSNSASVEQSDAIPDGRGMAIKVSGVTGDMIDVDEQFGPSQDFVMINHSVFFARNVKDFLRIEQSMVQGNGSPLATLQGALTGGDWNPLHWHWREVMTAAQIAAQLPAHPASLTYFSMTPIRFGKYVAKYRVRPTGEHLDSYCELLKQLATDPDAIRLSLEKTLVWQELLFEFQVQLRTVAESMPIEDASVQWPESESPYRTVAHLLLPRQEIHGRRNQPDYQNLSFNVWHALAAHRPLGGINRVRRAVYPISATLRRQATEMKSATADEEKIDFVVTSD